MKDEVKRRSESASGFHFFNLYQCCPRKFYFRYVKGWKNLKTAPPLIFGSAFHEAKAAFYLGEKLRGATKVGLKVLEEGRIELMDEEVYQELKWRLPIIFEKWVEAFGNFDKDVYKVLFVEKELKVPLCDGAFVATVRPDTILQGKEDGNVYIMETKTSGFSHRITGEAVFYGDQATIYLLAVRKVLKLEPYAVIPDVAYWNKQSKDLGNIKMVRDNIVFRDGKQTAAFEASIYEIFKEITGKVLEYKKGVSPWRLFPRNSHYCLSFSTPCDFAEICWMDAEKRGTKVPQGFFKQKGVRKLQGYVEDQIAIL